MHTCHTHVEWSEDNSQESVFSFHHVGSDCQIQGISKGWWLAT